MEEFRPVIVDSLVARLIGTKQVRLADFVQVKGHGCRISERARRTLIESYERRMLTLAGGSMGGHKPYRQLLADQGLLLAKAIEDEKIAYRPYLWR